MPESVPTQETSNITSTSKPSLQKKKVIFRTYQLIWYILGVFEVLLGFRFLLKAFGANPSTPFVRLVYNVSGGLIQPFRGVFGNFAVEGATLEWVSLVAMLVYLVIAFGLIHFFQLVKPINPKEVEEVVDNV